MCDTIVALSNSTIDGSVIFAKNSDRDPNEAHYLVQIPHANHKPDERVRCTYIEIPQVPETYGVLLAKPFWIWGAEMGANELGVVIGNEALFSRVPAGKEPGLIGMDYLRLALERAPSAHRAMDVIVELLEEYGQSGNCGFSHPIYYHNSYLIADRSEAWVLETVGKQWAAEKVKDIRTISNAITIGSKSDLASDGLVKVASEKGWSKKGENFDFGRCYSDRIYTRFSRGRDRQCRTTALLHASKCKIDLKTAFSILRDHGNEATSDWTPASGVVNVNVCMHAGFGPIRINQSTGSMVCRLSGDGDTFWFTGTSAPCTGIFKPVWFDSGLPDQGMIPDGIYNPNTLWWQHELLHRDILRDYTTRINVYRSERDELEGRFISEASQHQKVSFEERRKISLDCFAVAREATKRWAEYVHAMPVNRNKYFLYNLAWRGFNRNARLG